MELKPNQILELKEILEEKKWYTEDFFNLYCEFLKAFETDEEIELMLKLTRKFIWIRYENYLEFLKELLNKVYIEEGLENKTEIVVCPLIDNSSDELIYKTKSSEFLCYLVKSHEIQRMPLFKNKKNVIKENFYKFESLGEENYKKEIKVPSKYLANSRIVLLLDDFIGSGETAEKAVKFYTERCGFKIENIRILTISIHEDGLNKLKEIKGLKVYYLEKIKKIFSDIDFTSKDLEIMQKIEERLDIMDKEKLGYNQSQAVITLIRTPNNTLPAFRKKKRDFFPIFLR